MKLLFNMTINIDHAVHDQWMVWMTQIHIPEIMNTNCFESWKMSRVLGADDSKGINYAIQFVSPGIKAFEEFRDGHMKKLQDIHNQKFKDQYVLFMTLLEILDEGRIGSDNV